MIRNTLILILLFVISFPCQARLFWGLNNIDFNYPDSILVTLQSTFYSFDISWSEIEPEDNQFDWQTFDDLLPFVRANRYGPYVLMNIQVESPWATDGESRAPDDLDRLTPLSDDVPAEGYSDTFYQFVYRVVDRSLDSIGRRAAYYLVGDPQNTWDIDVETYEQDVDDYVRCLRTAHLAAHDAGTEHDFPVHVSFGGITYNTLLERNWFLLGEQNEDMRDSLLILIQSRYERDSVEFEDWNDLEERVIVDDGEIPPTLWQEVLAGQTEYTDWYVVDYSFKPRFVFDELAAFEQLVADSQGVERRWFASESGMVLQDGGSTDYDDLLHAIDFSKRIITAMRSDIEFCFIPMEDDPISSRYGLFSEERVQHSAYEVFLFFRYLDIGYWKTWDISNGDLKHYRTVGMQVGNEFGHYVDVFWKDVLFDVDTTAVNFKPTIEHPFDFARILGWQLYDIFGNIIDEGDSEYNEDSLSVGPEPYVMVWRSELSLKREEFRIHEKQFILNSIYPNPFNSELRIDYSLMIKGDTVFSLYTIDGREVWRYEKENQQPGSHSATIGIGNIPAGVYLLNMIANGASQSRKVVHLK